MIITLSDSTLNKHSAALLAKQADISPLSNSLLIIDIDTKPVLISRFKPNELAKYLIDSGLPREINQLYLVMSDINHEKNLVTYAHELAISFTEYHQREMTVHIPSQLSYDFTLLIPPSKNDQWEIYGFNNESQSKKLVWQGADLMSYMNDEQRTYTGISYVWPSA